MIVLSQTAIVAFLLLINHKSEGKLFSFFHFYESYTVLLLALLDLIFCCQICYIIHESQKYFDFKANHNRWEQQSSNDGESERTHMSESEGDENSQASLLRIEYLTDSMIEERKQASAQIALIWLDYKNPDEV